MIKVFLRDKNKKIKKDRLEGKIPGVLYGPNFNSTPIYIEKKDIKELKKHEAGLFEFEFENKKYRGILKEIQIHPITNEVIHFDIYVPILERKIETKVPIEFVGEAPVLNLGAFLNFGLKELEVEALPEDLPEKIVVDLSNLKEIGQSIYVKDLKLPENIKVLTNKETVIVTALSEIKEEANV